MERGSQRLLNVRIFVRPGPSGLSRLNGIFHKNNRSHILPDNGSGSGHANMQGIIFGTSRPQVFPTCYECARTYTMSQRECVAYLRMLLNAVIVAL